MSIVQRYIGRTVLSSIGLVFLIFIGLEIFIMFISELSDIGTGDYGVLQAFVHVLKLSPSQIYRLFPVSSLLGTLIGLGVLASSHELTVLRASGVSIVQIMGCVLRVAIVVMLLATFMGEVLGPSLEYQANLRKEMATSGGQALATPSGIWMRAGNDFILIGQVLSNENLRDVTVYRMAEDHQFESILQAKQVDYEGKQWIMRGVDQTLLNLKQVASQKIARKVWDVNLKPDLFNVGFSEPRAMNLIKLWRYIQYREKNGLQVASYRLAFWKRIYQPLATLVMMFLAIPFVFFGSLRTMTMGLRIIFGIMMGLGFFIFNELIGQFSLVFQMPAPFIALVPIILFASLGVILVKRI